MKPRVKSWAKGLVRAAISGATSAVTLTIVDPSKYNIWYGFGDLIRIAIACALVNSAMYLRSNPTPEESNPELFKRGDS